MVLGRWTEDREDDGDAAADGFGSVEFGGGGEEELFLSRRARGPGCDGGAEEVDGYGVLGGEGGAHGEVGDIDGGLREGGGDGDGGGFVFAVHGWEKGMRVEVDGGSSGGKGCLSRKWIGGSLQWLNSFGKVLY